MRTRPIAGIATACLIAVATACASDSATSSAPETASSDAAGSSATANEKPGEEAEAKQRGDADPTAAPVEPSAETHAEQTDSDEETAQPEADTHPPETTGDLWETYGAAVGTADEAEGFASFADLAANSDLVVVGTVTRVEVGRLIQLSESAPSSRLQFVNYTVKVERSTDSAETVTFELPVQVSSPELREAVQSAVQPQDLDGDGEISDDEAAKGYNEEGVAAAYERYWDDAVKQTLDTVRSRLPSEQTMFLLREVKDFGTLRPVNGDAIILNRDGEATTPWRDGSGEADEYPVARELTGMSFADVVDAAFATR